jgi:hypothetical protein
MGDFAPAKNQLSSEKKRLIFLKHDQTFSIVTADHPFLANSGFDPVFDLADPFRMDGCWEAPRQMRPLSPLFCTSSLVNSALIPFDGVNLG